jgi:hypothetical protein
MAVGLFDLLGFRALIETYDHRLEELRQKVISVVAGAIAEANFRDYLGSGKPGSSLFSDTLFLWIPATNEYGGAECVKRMCMVASYMLSRFMEASLPIRGAIAFGECFASTQALGATSTPATIFLGRPVVEAYELERACRFSRGRDPLVRFYSRAFPPLG